MKKTLLTLCALFFIVQFTAQNEHPKKPIQCTLRGEVRDLPNTYYLILEPFFEDRQIRIPIHNGEFEYVLNCDYGILYRLKVPREISGGTAFHHFNIFSEEGIVDLTFYLDPNDEHEVRYQLNEGPINMENERLGKKQNELVASLLDSLTLVEQQMQQASLIPLDKMRELQRERERIYGSIRQKQVDFTLQNAKECPNIVSYWAIVSIAISNNQFSQSQIMDAIEVYKTIYAPKFPNHPFTERMKALINSMEIVKEEGR